MRTALALLLLLHGMAHFAGVLTRWRILPAGRGDSPVLLSGALFGGRVQLGTVATHVLGIVWLAVGAAFVAAAFGMWRQSSWSWGAVIALCALSLVMVLVWWPAARIGVAVNLALLAAIAAAGLVAFRADMRRAYERLSHSSILETAAGPIEYAVMGKGIPVLALHGTAGGWDQAAHAAADLTRYGYRVITPSRFGYLRTPWRNDASPAVEADAFVALLDSLRIDRVAVLSWSAGAAPAMQLALRHPDRISRLVFFVPGAGGLMPPPPAPPLWVVDATFRWNFPVWAAQRLLPKMMLGWVAVPASLVPTLSVEDRAALKDGIEIIWPVRARHAGMLYDARSQSGEFGLFSIERVSAPTLWISAEDDLYGTLRVAQHAAATVPNASLLQYPSGGHLLLGRGADYWPRVDRFLRDSLPVGR